MNSLLVPFLVCYLYLCLVYIIGPSFMRNRQAYSLKYAILTYNILQMIANGVLFLLVSLIKKLFKGLELQFLVTTTIFKMELDLCSTRSSNSRRIIHDKTSLLLSFAQVFWFDRNGRYKTKKILSSVVFNDDFRCFLWWEKKIDKFHFCISITTLGWWLDAGLAQNIFLEDMGVTFTYIIHLYILLCIFITLKHLWLLEIYGGNLM